ncbi:MAG: hypothetical protein IPO34_21780 [Dehalococcoidia bacterium]|nr:hypothetical protein [Dehalococcoidia bacterium]
MVTSAFLLTVAMVKASLEGGREKPEKPGFFKKPGFQEKPIANGDCKTRMAPDILECGQRLGKISLLHVERRGDPTAHLLCQF